MAKGKLIVLEGNDGSRGSLPSDVNAYAASTFFAVDRYASYRTDWGEIYENGGLILSDRYTTSNAIHQGSKLPEAELPAFFDWLYDLEYGKMGLPRPDLVLYLDVDLPTSRKRMQHRQEKQNTKADIHEQDVSYLENCLRIGRLAAAHYGWTIVPFMKDGAERALEEKHEEIFSIIRSAQCAIPGKRMPCARSCAPGSRRATRRRTPRAMCASRCRCSRCRRFRRRSGSLPIAASCPRWTRTPSLRRRGGAARRSRFRSHSRMGRCGSRVTTARSCPGALAFPNRRAARGRCCRSPAT